MAYFPNGTAAEIYEERYCERCVHHKPVDGGCAVMFLHFMANYDECNNESSYLHTLIPRSADGLDNEQCTMFHEVQPPR